MNDRLQINFVHGRNNDEIVEFKFELKKENVKYDKESQDEY